MLRKETELLTWYSNVNKKAQKSKIASEESMLPHNTSKH